jgi:hypothetical protein
MKVLKKVHYVQNTAPLVDEVNLQTDGRLSKICLFVVLVALDTRRSNKPWSF